MVVFKQRTTCPDPKNKAYVSAEHGGKNHSILGNKDGRIYAYSVLPNCVGYVHGRVIELTGSDASLCRGNAENYFGYKDGFRRGHEPEVGSIMCWRKGKAGDSSDGAGHVVFVEEKKSNGDVIASESGWTGTKKNGRYWRLRTIKRAGGAYTIGSAFTYQGAIYIYEAEKPVFRLYNKNGGMHTFTISTKERDELVRRGWRLEGVAWRAPEHSEVPVFSIYNQNNGDHLLTVDSTERNRLLRLGLDDDGIELYSDTRQRVPVYRVYNRKTGEHFYTTDSSEYTQLCTYGWKGEGIAFYAAAKG